MWGAHVWERVCVCMPLAPNSSAYLSKRGPVFVCMCVCHALGTHSLNSAFSILSLFWPLSFLICLPLLKIRVKPRLVWRCWGRGFGLSIHGSLEPKQTGRMNGNGGIQLFLQANPTVPSFPSSALLLWALSGEVRGCGLQAQEHLRSMKKFPFTHFFPPC